MYQYNQGGFFARMPIVIKNIIIVSTFMLILTTINREFMLEHFALFFPTSHFFKPWQVITHMFMHGNFTHLLFNMYALWMFGSVLEQLWGPKKFLLYFFVTGLGAAALHMGVQWISISSLAHKIAANGPDTMAALNRYRMMVNVPGRRFGGSLRNPSGLRHVVSQQRAPHYSYPHCSESKIFCHHICCH